MATDTKRVLSIDLMRGLVMFVLVGFQPILWAMRGEIDAPAFKWLVGVFTHAEWEGLSVWDMVMPAFLFVSGVTIPFSLDKYRQSGDKLALLLGYAWSPWHPIIKRLWTSSMTLVSSGYALLLLSAFHFVVDEKGWTKGMMWLGYYGRNALVAYFLGEFVRFDSVVNSFAYALAPLVDGFYPAVLAFGMSLIIFAVLVLMDRAKVYVRL